MASFSRTSRARTVGTWPVARTGGKLPTPTRRERTDTVRRMSGDGSHMPIDTGMHWDWRNPLNVIPAFLLMCLLIGVLGTMFGW